MTNRFRTIAAFLLGAALLIGAASAHQSREVDDGYRVIVGLMVNPAYSGQLNGIDLIVRDADGEPVENLAASLTAVVIGPDGTELTLTLRAQADRPGYYTGDFIPTEAGNYQFRVSGFIGAVEFSEVFDEPAHSDPHVLDAATIQVP